ncbi:DUF2909 domain-containing protein [Aquabacterium sp. J223]|uniref:DUF2909 domain-containing protein n=1 Tax=Aquabacterium sp. J223 TaxID=2898431 RepID=UPI0021ADEA68|nr:DUF2909 domain-containing protein [Aquabacterium sp. J223]UUX95679.1 DUF2909 domain-containing protein [Aquabacterium sp. J223]
MKPLIALALVLILVALAGAGVFMLRKRPPGAQDGPADKRMARALAVRVGLSVAIFLLVLVGWQMGWITPSGALGR